MDEFLQAAVEETMAGRSEGGIPRVVVGENRKRTVIGAMDPRMDKRRVLRQLPVG